MIQNKQEQKNERYGIVTDILPGGIFKVDVGNGEIIKAYVSGRMRKNKIRIIIGDEVKIESSQYDSSLGRIIFRKVVTSG